MTVLDNVATGVLYGRERGEIEERGERPLKSCVSLDSRTRKASVQVFLKLADRKRLEVARSLGIGPKLLFLTRSLPGFNQREIDEAIQLVFPNQEGDGGDDLHG